MGLLLDKEGASKIQAIIDLLEAYGFTLNKISKIKNEADINNLNIEKIILPRPICMGIPIEFGDVKELTIKFEK